MVTTSHDGTLRQPTARLGAATAMKEGSLVHPGFSLGHSASTLEG
jgi:hypothetical protein